MSKRTSGVLMHITSLAGEFGIGTFGQSAYDFVDFLVETEQSYWQILPLTTTSYGDSPYQSFSSIAGNPHLIDFDLLVKEGWLDGQRNPLYDWSQHEKTGFSWWIYRIRESLKLYDVFYGLIILKASQIIGK